MEKKMETTIEFRVQGSRMEQQIETIAMGYMRTTIRIRSYIPS